MATPADSLTRELRRDGARPLITWYDDGTGARVELSVATTANWLAKTAGYLMDELGIEPGDTIVVDPALHWLTAVTLLAGWAVGADIAAEATPGARPVDVPLDPLGAAFSRLVAAYPDQFAPSSPSGGDLLSAAPTVTPGARILTVLPLDDTGRRAGLLAPLAAGGSVVYVVGTARVEAIAATERATHTAGVNVTGLPRLD